MAGGLDCRHGCLFVCFICLVLLFGLFVWFYLFGFFLFFLYLFCFICLALSHFFSSFLISLPDTGHNSLVPRINDAIKIW